MPSVKLARIHFTSSSEPAARGARSVSDDACRGRRFTAPQLASAAEDPLSCPVLLHLSRG